MHSEPFGIHTLLLTHPGILEKDSVNAGRRTQASCQAKVERSAKVTGAGCLGKLHLLSEASAKERTSGVLIKFQTCELMGAPFHDLSSFWESKR